MASLSSSATDLQGGGQAAPVINSGKVLSDESVSASVSIQRLPRILSAEDPGRFALITLTLINLLNYTDRYVPSATKQYIETDLHLSDAETSIPLMAFVFVYMIFSPIFSTLADMGFRRTRLIAGGVVIWSIATAAGALAFDFWSLLVSRALVGVGEAAYATIAPALLSDFYPARRRNAVLSIFYLAIPVGSAVGYVIGGEVGGYLGWRYAFLISGAPGLLVAAMCLVIKEPDQGAADDPLERHEFTVGHDHQHASDLMFGLNEAGMDNDSSDDETEAPRDPYDIAFAVESELGGPAITHPNGVHPAPSRRPTVVSGANTILVRPAAGGAEESTAIPVAADSDIEYSVTTGRPRHIPSPPWKESIVMLINNPYYMYSTVGLTFVTFASGGLADWTPSWMNRVHGVPKSTASTLVGILTCIAGIIGTAYGSWLGERAKGVIKQPYLGVAGLNMVVTAVCAWGVMLLPNIYLIGTLVFIAQVAMWSYTGPINALTLNCVPANMRVRAFAFQIFLSHALGDAISPTIIGVLSDSWDSIRSAMLIVPVAFSFGMATWVVGWRRLADSPSFDGEAHSPVQRSRAATGASVGDANDALSTSLLEEEAHQHAHVSEDSLLEPMRMKSLLARREVL